MPLNDVAILYKNHHVYALKYHPALALFPLRALLQLLQKTSLASHCLIIPLRALTFVNVDLAHESALRLS